MGIMKKRNPDCCTSPHKATATMGTNRDCRSQHITLIASGRARSQYTARNATHAQFINRLAPINVTTAVIARPIDQRREISTTGTTA